MKAIFPFVILVTAGMDRNHFRQRVIYCKCRSECPGCRTRGHQAKPGWRRIQWRPRTHPARRESPACSRTSRRHQDSEVGHEQVWMPKALSLGQATIVRGEYATELCPFGSFLNLRLDEQPEPVQMH